jgi:hypothetical protein
MGRQPRGPMWKERIVGRGHEAPDQLLAHPANAWKIHPEEQQDEVEKVLEQVGWVREILVNKRTGYVVDGHLRVQLAMRRGEESVPVTYLDISEAEEKLLIGVLDPLAAMSARDNEKLDELLTDLRDAFPSSEVDLDAILKREKRERTKGLTHTVHACKCCEAKCKPGCGCWREEDAPPEPQRYPVRHRKKAR